MFINRMLKHILLVVVTTIGSLSPLTAGSQARMTPHIKASDAAVLKDMKVLFATNNAKTAVNTFLEALKFGTKADPAGALLTPTEYFALPLAKRPTVLHPHTVSLLAFAVDRALYGEESKPNGYCRAFVWSLAASSRLDSDPFKKKPIYLVGLIGGGPGDWKVHKGLNEQYRTIPGTESILNLNTAKLNIPLSGDLRSFVDGWDYVDAILQELQALRSK